MERRKVGTAVEKEGWDWWRGERLGLVEGRKVGTGGGEEGWDWWREGRLGLVEGRKVGTGGGKECWDWWRHQRRSERYRDQLHTGDDRDGFAEDNGARMSISGIILSSELRPTHRGTTLLITGLTI